MKTKLLQGSVLICNMHRALLIIACTGLLTNVTGSLVAQSHVSTYGNKDNSRFTAIQAAANGGYVLGGSYDTDGLFTAQLQLAVLDSLGDTLWVRTYGNQTDGAEDGSGNEGFGVLQAMDGHLLIAGESHSFGQGVSDIYVVKAKANGDTVWSRTLGGTFSDLSYDIVETADSGYVLAGLTESFGQSVRNAYVAKLSKDGQLVWTKVLGGMLIDAFYEVCTTSDGGLAAVGYSHSFGPGGADVFLVRLDANGTILWERAYGGTADDFGYGIAETSDSGFVIVGSTSSFAVGSEDALMMKVDAHGVLEWAHAYGGHELDGFNAVTPTPSGFAAIGYTRSIGAGFYDLLAIHTDNTGDTLWVKTFGGTGEDVGIDLLVDQSDILLAGYTRSFGLAEEALLIRLDSLGQGPCEITNQALTITTANLSSDTSIADIAQGGVMLSPKTVTGATHTRRRNVCDYVSDVPELTEGTDVYLFPNPAKDFVHLRLSSGMGEAQVILLDLSGQVLRRWSGTSGPFRLEGLGSGAYYLQVEREDGHRMTVPFIKR